MSERNRQVTRRSGEKLEVGYLIGADADVYLDLSTEGMARYAYPSETAAASDGWVRAVVGDCTYREQIARFVGKRRKAS